MPDADEDEKVLHADRWIRTVAAMTTAEKTTSRWRKLYPKSSNPISLVALILANLVPVFMVITGHISIAEIMVLYWIENVIVGVYQLLKLVTASFTSPGGGCGCFMVPFFIIHYGMFTTVHGAFIFMLFGSQLAGGSDSMIMGSNPFNALDGLLIGIKVLTIPVTALFISHGVSFYMNYIRNGEFRVLGIQTLMHQPYKRVIIMHVTIIFAAFVSMALNAHVFALVFLTGLKIAVDLMAHLREHASATKSQQVMPPTPL